jgi:hypothetical protein
LIGRGRTARPAGELHVFFACHELVCAVPAQRVGRLLLDEEVAAPLTGAGWPTVIIDDVVHPVWDLGELLGRPALRHAWVTVRTEVGGHAMTVALRTGPCLVVRPLAERRPAPPSAHVARSAAFPYVFRTEGLVASVRTKVGLVLDVDRLWTAAERARASTSLTGGGAP